MVYTEGTMVPLLPVVSQRTGVLLSLFPFILSEPLLALTWLWNFYSSSNYMNFFALLSSSKSTASFLHRILENNLGLSVVSRWWRVTSGFKFCICSESLPNLSMKNLNDSSFSCLMFTRARRSCGVVDLWKIACQICLTVFQRFQWREMGDEWTNLRQSFQRGRKYLTKDCIFDGVHAHLSDINVNMLVKVGGSITSVQNEALRMG